MHPFKVFREHLTDIGGLLSCVCPASYSRSRSRSQASLLNGIDDEDLRVPGNLASSQQNQIFEKPPTKFPSIKREFVDFPFFIDPEIGNLIVHNRFMFIMRGPPGSGKSYLTECIRHRFPSTVVCSADNFFYLASNGVEYQFDITRLHEAHRWCQSIAYKAVSSGASPIVIDNTNIRVWETRYYCDLARHFHYFVIMVTPQTPWRFDTEALAMRNIHFVGIDTIESKVRNFEPVYPLYYGWFWPNLKSCNSLVGNLKSVKHGRQSEQMRSQGALPLDATRHFLSWAWETITAIMNLAPVHEEFVRLFDLPNDASTMDILSHWRSATIPCLGDGLKSHSSSAVPHVTACFSRFGTQPGAVHYGMRRAVAESLLGSMYTVQVTGLVITLRTIGARIRLQEDDNGLLQHLWASNDHQILSEDQLPTTRPFGCRAHVTLALATGVSAVQTGLDLLRVVDEELHHNLGEQVAIMTDGSTRCLKLPPKMNGTVHTEPNGAQCQAEPIYIYDLDCPHHYRLIFAAAY